MRKIKKGELLIKELTRNYYKFNVFKWLSLGPRYADGISEPLGFPNSQPIVPTPHEISDTLFEVLHKHEGNAKQVSAFHMSFGQFLDHDFSLTPNADTCRNPT